MRTATGDGRADQQAQAADVAAGEASLGGRQVAATLAVLPFESSDSATDELSLGFAELLTADLGRFPGLRLLERIRLDDLLHEQGLDSARIDPASAVRVGRLLAAQQLVRGAMAADGDTAIRFDVGLVDVGTSALTAAYAGAARADAIFVAERLVVQRLASVLGLMVPPDLEAKMAARASFPPDAFRAFARGARQEAEGDMPAALASYARAAEDAPSFDVAVSKTASLRRAVDRNRSGATTRPRRVPRVARPGGRSPT
ncbi:MAG: hypothetical protein HY275_11905 [Gemmatimonadetes bacterium]|nr:hypothetical protein [Gemmatimonadota bacterium]